LSPVNTCLCSLKSLYTHTYGYTYKHTEQQLAFLASVCCTCSAWYLSIIWRWQKAGEITRSVYSSVCGLQPAFTPQEKKERFWFSVF